MEQAPIEQTTVRSAETEELRLALSLRGGVSLAVWIGGAVAEIDALRKSSHALAEDPVGESLDVYGQLLRLARYDEVTVDILTGASAGGLNGVIYAASLVYNFDFSQMDDVWLEVADVETLSRLTPARGGDPQRESLFEGDAYFQAVARKKLTEMIQGSADPSGGVRRLDLFLSSTRLLPKARKLANDVFNDIEESRSAAFFHFRHLGGIASKLSDFSPRAGREDLVESLAAPIDDLALAGRATSSFPIAFEPATIEGMYGVFSDAEFVPAPEPIKVIDGGLLDNIPVTRAIEAIAGAPADNPATRWLLYLHPSPNEAAPPTPRATRAKLTGVLSDLKRSLALKFDSESLVDDMAELDRHNRRVGERRAAREALLEAAVVSTVPASRFSSWATTDSLRIGEVLTDPSMAVATHPFPPVAPVGSFDGWPGLMRTVFDRQLSVMLEEQYRDLADPLPVLALGDTVETLLVLTQQVVVDRQGVSPEKFLYRVRLLVEVLHSIWEQTWAVEAASVGSLDSADDVANWIERVALLARAASENVPASLLEVMQTGDDLAFHEQLHEIHQLPSAGRASDWEDLGRMWEAVADQANHLIAAAGDLEDPVVDALRRLGADGLRAYAAATAPLHRRVMRGESPIKFIRVSGSNETPFAPWFSATKRVMAEDRTVVNRLAVEDKLAGNQLVNFGAFFSAQWRANDWMWGRLDTAASLVDLLADSTRWVAHTDGSWQEMERLVRGCVRMPLTAVPHAGWMEHLAQLWKEAETDIRAELQAASLAPDVPQELPHTKRLLVSRLQADILASDIRWVAEAEEVEPEPTKPPTADFDEAKTLVGGLTAGTDRIPFDLEPGRWSRIGMRLGLNAWPALMPAGRVPRAVLGAIKPVFLFTLAALVFPRRTLTAGVLGYAALAVGRWEVDTEVLGTADLIASNLSSDYHTWQRWAACVVAVGLAAALALTDGRQASLGWFKVTGYAAGYLALGAGVVTAVEQHWTWTFVLLGVVVVGFGLSAFDRVRAGRHLQLVLVLAGAATGGAALAAVIMEVSIVPIVVPVAAVAVTALAMRWMRLRSWLICFVVALAPYMAVALVPGLSPGWWALISFVLAVSAVTVYVTYFEVFPPRKRGDLTLPGTPQSTVDSA